MTYSLSLWGVWDHCTTVVWSVYDHLHCLCGSTTWWATGRASWAAASMESLGSGPSDDPGPRGSFSMAALVLTSARPAAGLTARVAARLALLPLVLTRALP